ncbi:glutaredoxin 3 [Salinarimonas ramus]|uniref:Glutaredoxin n=1 Tax=Salinarimonas ramus TaxID=690164 RepID=A0A917QAY6_9HYPH|nr:glutaredoxin 3 [Salinarimonas ramus]GGK40637.1 glutaredoxin [Salinarimonas ramus]
MKPIEIYLRTWCPYCIAAKGLLDKKGAAYTVIDIEAEPERRREMIERANGRSTVPQIFVGETHVGGFDDLSALDRAGRLDPLLAA